MTCIAVSHLVATLVLAAAGSPPVAVGQGVERAGAPRAGASSEACIRCHTATTPGIVGQWRESAHARRGVGCLDCHRAFPGEADAFQHHGELVATVVTPRDCARCHSREDAEYERSHHARAGSLPASLDNVLGEAVEGARERFDPHAPVDGKALLDVNGLAAAQRGCWQCHGSKVALQRKGGGRITVDDLRPGPDGRPTQPAVLDLIARDGSGRPLLDAGTWPNTGVGRINLDGSLGSCTACHSRHDFSPRRARQPENCGRCHLGPDHPQREIFEASKHGIAYRDSVARMSLDARSWVLGKDYTAAPTCASCHMSANVNGGKVTHDPRERLSWDNRPPVSVPMDTDAQGRVVAEADPARRAAPVADSAQAKRRRMQQACVVCHSQPTVDAFYQQYDDLIVLYDEKFARPAQAIVEELKKQGLISRLDFDDRIEWDWFYLWHHEGRRARNGAAMMSPEHTQWYGMAEVADRFYRALIPEAREIVERARSAGKREQADAASAVIEGILRRPEHAWFGKERSSPDAGSPGAGPKPPGG